MEGYTIPSDAELEDITQDAIVWANQHGLVRARRSWWMA
jgi:hypothetical protein